MGIRLCPKCGGKVSDSRNNCIHCGYVFPSLKKCPDCGEDIDINAKECPICGYPFEQLEVSPITKITDNDVDINNTINVVEEEKIDNEMLVEKEELIEQDNLLDNQLEKKVICPYCNSENKLEIGINYYMCITCKGKFMDIISNNFYHGVKPLINVANNIEKEHSINNNVSANNNKYSSDINTLEDEKKLESYEKSSNVKAIIIAVLIVLIIGSVITLFVLHPWKAKKKKTTYPYITTGKEDWRGVYNGFVYQMLGQNEIEIIGYEPDTINDSFLIIPPTIKEIPVVKINNAFNNSNITYVEIPFSIRLIEYSFNNCHNLKTIVFSGNVHDSSYKETYFHVKESFDYCDNISELNVMDNTYDYVNEPYFSLDGISEILKKVDNDISLACSAEIYNMINAYELHNLKELTLYGSHLFDDGDWNISLNRNLKKINLPSSLNCIGGDLAREISEYEDNIPSLEFNSDEYGFYLGNKDNPYVLFVRPKSDDLTSIVVNDMCRIINDDAFEGYNNLEQITISSNLVYVGRDAFCGCTSLNFNVDEYGYYLGNEDNPYNVFVKPKKSEEIYINNNCRIVSQANNWFNDIKKVVIPNSVEIICDGAFSGWNIVEVNLNTNLKSINSAFSSCHYLESITIPNEVTKLCNYEFAYCTNLKSITIPNSVTRIGNNAFYDCTSLTSITIPNGVTSIGNQAFDDCTGLTSITIPNSVISIGTGAFSGCTGLTSITIPNSVTRIGNNAFYDCTSLTSITIPNSVTRIEDVVFSGCTSLNYIIIPKTIEYICYSAINTSITKIFYNGTLNDLNENVAKEWSNKIYYYSSEMPYGEGKYWHYNTSGEPEIW